MRAPGTPRRDGWTAERRAGFLVELTTCGVVKEAARRVGMSAASAHRLRARPDGVAFALAWDGATQLCRDTVQATLIERVIDGTPRGVYYRGRRVGTETVYSDRLAAAVLKLLPTTDCA